VRQSLSRSVSRYAHASHFLFPKLAARYFSPYFEASCCKIAGNTQRFYSLWSQKSLAKNHYCPIFKPINGTPNDQREASVAHAGRTLESAARYTRGGGAPAPDHDSDHATRTKRIEVEQRRLIRWAKENGKLGGRRLPPEFGRGGEHLVYFQKRTQRYLKATLLERQLGYGIALGSLSRGATPSEYLDRLDLQNQIFDDDIRLERIVLKSGRPIILTSQPFINGGVTTASAVDELMLGKGYEKLTDGAYYSGRDGLLMFDLFPRNAIQAADGQIYPIDPVIQRITPDFAAFLRAEPYTINLVV
jgi:hypothetical protein